MALSVTAIPADTVTANKAPVVAQPATSGQKSSQSGSTPASSHQDTVKISSAAYSALQEATETAAQTSTEARNGDLQARRLLAKEAAGKQA